MLEIGLVAYLFHEMDESFKDVPRIKVDILLFFLYNPLYLDTLLHATFPAFA